MRVNHTRIIQGAVSCFLAISISGCAAESDDATTHSRTEALQGSGAFARLFGPPRGRRAPLASEVVLGQERLCRLQADIVGDGAGNGLDDNDPDDGGWDFTLDTDATEHSASASPSNTYGATALALIVLGRATDARGLGCALDAAQGMQANLEVDSPPDFVYWVLLGDLTGNPGFAELAASRYTAKRDAAGGAEALGQSIQDLRHGDGDDGLIGYDLAWLTFAAIALDTALPAEGYGADANAYAGLIASDLESATPLFDMNDGSEAFYTDGLSWSLLALHAARLEPSLQRTLKGLLVDTQLDSGAFGYNQDFPEPDLQATSGALLALERAGRAPERAAREAALGYLVLQQTEDGGWDYAPGAESTLASAEILFALGLSREAPPPEAASVAVASAASRRAAPGREPSLVAPLD